jgi:hypothetical protein
MIEKPQARFLKYFLVDTFMPTVFFFGERKHHTNSNLVIHQYQRGKNSHQIVSSLF